MTKIKVYFLPLVQYRCISCSCLVGPELRKCVNFWPQSAGEKKIYFVTAFTSAAYEQQIANRKQTKYTQEAGFYILNNLYCELGIRLFSKARKCAFIVLYTVYKYCIVNERNFFWPLCNYYVVFLILLFQTCVCFLPFFTALFVYRCITK
jgi:hypothetical protein